MFETGLVSVSFRQEQPETIIAAVKQAGLSGIEWGGDIHVPCGDILTAQKVGNMTRDAGLKVMAYGSYYRLGMETADKPAFQEVLKTTEALGAPVIRVWAGTAGSVKTAPEERRKIVAEARKIAQAAAEKQMTVTLECHHDTLTDRWESALRLLGEVGHPNLKMYWQPNQYLTFADNKEAAEQLAAVTINLHVFQWDSQKKYPLADGTANWQEYLEIFRNTGKSYGLLLEFMHDDRLETLQETAATLKFWLGK